MLTYHKFSTPPPSPVLIILRKNLNSKDRVITVVSHKEADRVPFDYWAAPEVTLRVQKGLGLNNEEELLQYFDVDLRYVNGPGFIGQEMKKYEDGTIEDLWGVRILIINMELF